MTLDSPKIRRESHYLLWAKKDPSTAGSIWGEVLGGGKTGRGENFDLPSGTHLVQTGGTLLVISDRFLGREDRARRKKNQAWRKSL